MEGIARSGWASKWMKRRPFDGNIFFLQHARRNGMTSQWSSEKKEKKEEDRILFKHSHRVIVLPIKQSPWSSASEKAEILKLFWEAGYAPTMQQLIVFWFILNYSQNFVPIFIINFLFAHLKSHLKQHTNSLSMTATHKLSWTATFSNRFKLF